MGTHPIFESDFDCLTDFVKKMSRNVRKISAQSESLQRSNIDMEQRLVEVKRLFEKEKSKREKEALNWASSAGLGDGSLAQTRAVKNSRSKGALDSQSRKILGKGYDRKRWLLFCVKISPSLEIILI